MERREPRCAANAPLIHLGKRRPRFFIQNGEHARPVTASRRVRKPIPDAHFSRAAPVAIKQHTVPSSFPGFHADHSRPPPRQTQDALAK